MSQVVTPEEMRAVTAPFLEKIQPEPTPTREQQLEAENARIRHTLDELSAKYLTVRADLSLALDALKTLAGSAQMAVTELEGEEIVL